MTVHVNCWCVTCEEMILTAREMNGDQGAWFGRRFIVCPDCGNKRCPRAAHHDRKCTGSNEPGQAGSAYGNAGQEFLEHLRRTSTNPTLLRAVDDLMASREAGR